MTLRTRIIPCLQLIDENLVKTVKFRKPAYIGDFNNTVKIFNELEVDELCLLSIRATEIGHLPNLYLLSQVAEECFMPLSYGGGITDLETAKKIFSLGFEKVVINSQAFIRPELIRELAEHFGSQSIVVSIDVKKNLFGNYTVYSNCGKRKQKVDVVEWAEEMQHYGAGEILLTSMDRDGTWEGYDISLINMVSNNLSIPVIANGGAGSLEHISGAINQGCASAVAVGSMVVYQQKGMGVLVSFPDRAKVREIIN